MKLFDLADEFLHLRYAYQNDEDIDEDMLKQAEERLEEQVKAYCIIVKEIKAEEKALADQKRKISERQVSLTKNRNRLLGALHNIQTAVGKPKVSIDGHRSNICKKPRSVTIENEDLIGDDYVVVKTSFNKDLVKKQLKETGEIPEGFGLSKPETYIRVS